MTTHKRASGILLHPTSLPGNYGIGTLGRCARDFVDFLNKAKQTYWQVLPLGPTGFADSPYQCFSAHAGNPNMIDLEELVGEGLLTSEELATFPHFAESLVDFEEVVTERARLLETAFQRFSGSDDQRRKLKFRNFQKEHRWLNDYALFRAIHTANSQTPWYEWDEPIKLRDPAAIIICQKKLKEQIDYEKFLQFLFFSQWLALKDYAHKRSVRIIGDIPIYVALDSADAWANTPLFEFDPQNKPLRVGGVPPDYFSETGQLWGNPLFRWKERREELYSWWVDRIRTNLLLFDIIRIDHFRGFAAYWAVPFGNKTAQNGTWVTGPGRDLFDVILERIGTLPVIAEDLGVITEDVNELRDRYYFPGMKILGFAFDSAETNNYLPYTYDKNCVVYTGTHDNNTIIGWFRSASEIDRKFALEYTNSSGDEINWDMIRLAWASVANTAIVPLQDLLGLDETARMNIPGTTEGNWRWRALKSDFTDELAIRLAELTSLYGRFSG